MANAEEFVLTSDMIIVATKNEENYFASEADDDPSSTREILSMKRCIEAHACTKKDGSMPSWKKMLPWTILDGKTMEEAKMLLLGHLKYHLKASGHHLLSEEDADRQIREQYWTIEFHQYTDTHAMRAHYRKQNLKAQQWRDEQTTAKKKRKCGGKEEGSGSQSSEVSTTAAASSSVQSLVATLQNMAPALQQALAQRYVGGDRDDINLQVFNSPPAPAITNVIGTASIDVQRIVNARENVRRSEEAAQSAMCTLVEAAKRLRSEACALTQARENIDELLRDLQR